MGLFFSIREQADMDLAHTLRTLPHQKETRGELPHTLRKERDASRCTGPRHVAVSGRLSVPIYLSRHRAWFDAAVGRERRKRLARGVA